MGNNKTEEGCITLLLLLRRAYYGSATVPMMIIIIIIQGEDDRGEREGLTSYSLNLQQPDKEINPTLRR